MINRRIAAYDHMFGEEFFVEYDATPLVHRAMVIGTHCYQDRRIRSRCGLESGHATVRAQTNCLACIGHVPEELFY